MPGIVWGTWTGDGPCLVERRRMLGLGYHALDHELVANPGDQPRLSIVHGSRLVDGLDDTPCPWRRAPGLRPPGAWADLDGSACAHAFDLVERGRQGAWVRCGHD